MSDMKEVQLIQQETIRLTEPLKFIKEVHMKIKS